MKYITYKRFKGTGLVGNVNIPYGTMLESVDNIISHDGAPIAYTTSQVAYDYFARNDDGQGLKRGKLISQILHLLDWSEYWWKYDRPQIKSNPKDPKNFNRVDDRWQELWAHQELYKFRRMEHLDHWLWNFNFYNAEISELEYILSVIDK